MSSPSSSMRHGASNPGEKQSMIPPRIAASPGSVTVDAIS